MGNNHRRRSFQIYASQSARSFGASSNAEPEEPKAMASAAAANQWLNSLPGDQSAIVPTRRAWVGSRFDGLLGFVGWDTWAYQPKKARID